MANSSPLQGVQAVDAFDPDKEIATLIRLFSQGQGDDRDGCSGCRTKPELKSNDQNSLKRAVNYGTEVLPPPSPFIRRRQPSHAVPFGPSFAQADVEPSACIASSSQNESHPGPHDLYDAVFDIIVCPLDAPLE
jgi:hypothetical protein